MKKSISKDLIMAPMPVLIIGTYDEKGIPNAMNAAWGGQSDFDEVTVYLGQHKTTENLKTKKAFTIAFATKETLIVSDYFGIESGHQVNKIEKAGYHVSKSPNIDAPIIEEYPLVLECEVSELTEYAGDWRLSGKVVNVLADENIVDKDGKVDLSRLNLICFDASHHTYRVVGEVVGKAFDEGKKIK